MANLDAAGIDRIALSIDGVVRLFPARSGMGAFAASASSEAQSVLRRSASQTQVAIRISVSPAVNATRVARAVSDAVEAAIAAEDVTSTPTIQVEVSAVG